MIRFLLIILAGCNANHAPLENSADASQPKEDAGHTISEPFKGSIVTTWDAEGYADPQIANVLGSLQDNHMNTVSVIATWYQPDRRQPSFARTGRTPTNDSIRAIAAEAKRRGMRFVIKPHIDLTNEEWRGTISMRNETDWTIWFENYRHYIAEYSELANELDADLLVIGTELKQTVSRPEWQLIIRTVKERYDGPIVYAANWDNINSVPFWTELDFIGVDAYWPVSSSRQPTLEELKLANQQWVTKLEELADRQGKQVLLTEFGYQDRDGTTMTPWWVDPGSPDSEEQALAYEAMLSEVTSSSRIHGAMSWMTYKSPLLNVDGFDIIGKPAENVLKDAYALWELPQSD